MKYNVVLSGTICLFLFVGAFFYFGEHNNVGEVKEFSKVETLNQEAKGSKLLPSETPEKLDEAKGLSVADKSSQKIGHMVSQPALKFDIKLKDFDKVPQDVIDEIKSTIIEPEKDAKLLLFKILNDEWLEEECEEVHYCLNRYISGDDSWEYNAIVVKQLGLMRIAEKKEGRFYLPDISEGVYWVYLKLKNKPTQFVQVLKMNDVFQAQVKSGLSLQVKLTGSSVERDNLRVRVVKRGSRWRIFAGSTDRFFLDAVIYDAPVDLNRVRLSLSPGAYSVQFYIDGYLGGVLRDVFLKTNHAEILNLDELKFYQLKLSSNIKKFNDDFSFDGKELVVDQTIKYFTSSADLSVLVNLLDKKGWKAILNKPLKEITVEYDSSKYVDLVLKDQYGNDISGFVEYRVVRKESDEVEVNKDETLENLNELYDSGGLFCSSGERPKVYLSAEDLALGQIEILFFIDPEKKNSYKFKISEATQKIEQVLVLNNKFYAYVKFLNIDFPVTQKDIEVGREDMFTQKFTISSLTEKNKMRVLLPNCLSGLSGLIKDSFDVPNEEQKGYEDFYKENELIDILVDGYELCRDVDLSSGKTKEISLIKSQMMYLKFVDSNDEPLKNIRIRFSVHNLNGRSVKYDLFADVNGLLSVFVISAKLQISFSSEFADVEVVRSYLYSADNPLTIKQILINDYLVVDHENQPVSNAAVFLDTSNPNYSRDVDHVSSVLVKYSNQKGAVTLASKFGRLVGAFHSIKGAYFDRDVLLDTGENYEPVGSTIQLDSFASHTQTLRFFDGKLEDYDTLVDISLLNGLVHFYSKAKLFSRMSKYLVSDANISINSNNSITIVAGEYITSQGKPGSDIQVYYPFRGKKLEILSELGDTESRGRFSLNLGFEYNFKNEININNNVMTCFFDDLDLITSFTINCIDLSRPIRFNLLVKKREPHAEYFASKSYQLNTLPYIISLSLELQKNRGLSILDSNNQPIPDVNIFGRSEENSEFERREVKTLFQNGLYEIKESELKGFVEILIKCKDYSSKIIELTKLTGMNDVVFLEKSDLLLLHYDIAESRYVTFVPGLGTVGTDGWETLDEDKKLVEVPLSEGFWSLNFNGVNFGVHIEKGKNAEMSLKPFLSQNFHYSFSFKEKRNLIVESDLDGLGAMGRDEEVRDEGYLGHFIYFYDHSLSYYVEEGIVEVPLGLIKNGEKINIDLEKDVFKERPSILYYKLFKNQPFNFYQRANLFNLSQIQKLQSLYQLIEEDSILSIKKYTSASDLISRQPALGLEGQQLSVEMPMVKVKSEWLLVKDFGFIELKVDKPLSLEIDYLGDEILAFFAFAEDGVYVVEKPNGIVDVFKRSKKEIVTFDVVLIAKKGVVALYAENHGACIPIVFDHILGEFLGGDRYRETTIYNLGEKVSFRANGVPVGRYHFVVFDPETDTSYSSASFEVTSQTKELSLDIK